jgi:hypothetical protein
MAQLTQIGLSHNVWYLPHPNWPIKKHVNDEGVYLEVQLVGGKAP